jgi:excisionase family DNA binding protein
MQTPSFSFDQATYSVAETMRHLSIGRTKLYALIADGKLKPRKIGKKTVFPASELARFIAELKPAA